VGLVARTPTILTQHCRELDPPEQGFVRCKDHQSGKWVRKPRPPEMPFPGSKSRCAAMNAGVRRRPWSLSAGLLTSSIDARAWCRRCSHPFGNYTCEFWLDHETARISEIHGFWKARELMQSPSSGSPILRGKAGDTEGVRSVSGSRPARRPICAAQRRIFLRCWIGDEKNGSKALFLVSQSVEEPRSD